MKRVVLYKDDFKEESVFWEMLVRALEPEKYFEEDINCVEMTVTDFDIT